MATKRSIGGGRSFPGTTRGLTDALVTRRRLPFLLAALLLPGCAPSAVKGTPPTAVATGTATISLVATGSPATSPPSAAVDEPSPPGGLGNVVESYSRSLGRPAAAFGVNQPSYTYGDWPIRGTFILLDNDLRRAREVRINFGAPLTLVDAQAHARSYLPIDAKPVGTFTEAGTGDAGTVYTSERLAAAFPTGQPRGQFVAIYDGVGDQVSGLILRMGSAEP